MPDSASLANVQSDAHHLRTERRRFVRYSLRPRPRTRWLVQPELRLHDGLLKDISVHGLCLILDHALPLGQQLVVQLRGQQRGGSLCRVAKVQRVEPDGAGQWLVGCELITPLTNEQMRSLGN
jgi:hypothetical protein